MPEIDLKPHEYRSGPLRQHPLVHKAFMRSAVAAAVYFALVVAYGRLFAPPIHWTLVALVASAPGLMLAFIAISLDED